MKKVLLFILFFILLIVTKGDSQPRISTRSAAAIRTKTTNFDNVLSSSDTSSQKAFDTIDDTGAQIILDCDRTTDVVCFEYSLTNQVLYLYVNNNLEAQWPSVLVEGFALLEDDTFILLEDGGKVLFE